MEINQIHNQFQSILRNFISVRVPNSNDAEYIVQDVLMKIPAKLYSLGDAEKIKGWIYDIIRYAISEFSRKNSSKVILEVIDEMTEGNESESITTSIQAIDRCLMEYIQMLPEEFREFIIDSEINNINQSDLAEKYDLAYPSARSRIHRGRIQLKEMIMNCCMMDFDN